jgi:hypothetical protein
MRMPASRHRRHPTALSMTDDGDAASAQSDSTRTAPDEYEPRSPRVIIRLRPIERTGFPHPLHPKW